MSNQSQMVEAVARGADEMESVQKRFQGKDGGRHLYSYLMQIPQLSADLPQFNVYSPTRDRFLATNWMQVPIWAGMLRNEVAINANRKYTIVGGRNAVNRARRQMGNYWVAPDVYGYRAGVMLESLAYHTQDLGAVIETARVDLGRSIIGPILGFYHVDPSQCYLTGDLDTPLVYQSWHTTRLGLDDYWRIGAMPMTMERFHGLGMCSTSLAWQVLQVLYLAHRHDRGELDPGSLGGIAFVDNISQDQLQQALGSRSEGENWAESFFRRLGVIASEVGTPQDELPNIRTFLMSALPKRLEDPQKYTELCVSILSLILGRDPAEYWPMSQGTFGRSNESEIQHIKSTQKAGNEYIKRRQDQLNHEVYGLARSVVIEYEERDDQGNLLSAQVANTWADFVNKLRLSSMEGEPVLTKEAAAALLVEKGQLDPALTDATDDAKATDEKNATRTFTQIEIARMRDRAMATQRIEGYVNDMVEKGRPEEIVRVVGPDYRQRPVVLMRVLNGDVIDPRTGEALYRDTFWVNRQRRAHRVQRMQAVARSADVLFADEDDDFVITEADVDAAIAAAEDRVGDDWAELMVAEPVDE